MIKPSDYFALALRIFGVIIFLFGFRQLTDVFLGYLNYHPFDNSYFRYDIIVGLGEIFAGLYLVRRGAPLIVEYAYPDEIIEEIEEDADVSAEIVKNENDVFDGQEKI
jgi:hypothetical protein